MTRPPAPVGLSMACAIAFLASVGATAASPAATGGGTATAGGTGSESGLSGTSAPGRMATSAGMRGDLPNGAVGRPADGVNDAVRGTNAPAGGIDGTTGGTNRGPVGNPADSPRGPLERIGE